MKTNKNDELYTGFWLKIKLLQPQMFNENYILPFGHPIVWGLILQYSVTFMPALHAKHSAICAWQQTENILIINISGMSLFLDRVDST